MPSSAMAERRGPSLHWLPPLLLPQAPALSIHEPALFLDSVLTELSHPQLQPFLSFILTLDTIASSLWHGYAFTNPEDGGKPSPASSYSM